jgi:hypothetical protein
LQILNALHDANDLRDLLKLRVLDVLYAMDDPSKRRKLYNSIVSHSMVGDLNLRHSLDDPHQRVEISESHNKTIHEVK